MSGALAMAEILAVIGGVDQPGPVGEGAGVDRIDADLSPTADIDGTNSTFPAGVAVAVIAKVRVAGKRVAGPQPLQGLPGKTDLLRRSLQGIPGVPSPETAGLQIVGGCLAAGTEEVVYGGEIIRNGSGGGIRPPTEANNT